MITLRPLLFTDIPVIRAWPEYPAEFAGLDYALRDGGWLDCYHGNPGTETFAATDSGEIVGFSLLSRDGRGGAEFRVALRPDCIGRGYGRMITRLTLARGFSEPAIRHISLIVRKNNLRAQRLYLAEAFRFTGECSEEIQGCAVPFFTMEIDRDTFFQDPSEESQS